MKDYNYVFNIFCIFLIFLAFLNNGKLFMLYILNENLKFR